VGIVANSCFVRAAFRPANGAWSAPQTLSQDCRTKGVAIDERGDAIVVWLTEHGPTAMLEAAGRSATGRWTPRAVIAQAPVIEGPQVGMDARGDAIVVWSEFAPFGARRSMWARIRRAGHGWQAARTIPHVEGYPPSLAVDARGDALVAWQDQRGIEAVARPADGRWQRSQTVSRSEPSNLGPKEAPLAALDARGDGLVSWPNDKGIETAWRWSLFRRSRRAR
jgi:hypothetical protein